MAQPKSSNGVPPKAAKSKKQQDELTEKLRKVEDAAENGTMPSAVVESLNEQVNLSKTANGRPALDPHSKPPFELPEGQSVPDSSEGNGAVEPHDTPMGEATNNDGSQPAAADPGRNDSVEPIDRPMTEATNKDTSEPPMSMMPGSLGESVKEEDDMLVSFQKMSIGGSQFGGQPEAWFSTGSSTKAIVRHGPLKGAMYNIQSAKGYNLRNLPEASDKNSRITQIWDRDENGRRHRRFPVVEFLLQNSADINQKSPSGTSPLQIAIIMEHIDIVRRLLSYKETLLVNEQDCHSFTALMLASARGKLEVVKILLEHPNLNLNAMDDQGRTPFWWAAAGGHFDIVQLLANQSGVKKRLKDSNGLTAYAIAKKHKHGHITVFLRSF
ncbi:hypothetical protein N7523_008359 [Penicillium sp. IBT 18751x]|nr:hypothetical protein N7523_008359 [Penicillium sp. IBT 18751x]